MNGNMQITKSSRHAKIVGDFGEQLVANWLSRSGWEVVLVDHTGIDLVAFDRRTNARIGITVKSRTRLSGTERVSVNVFHNRKGDRAKVARACVDFACEPWLAIYVEAGDSADLFLTNLAHYDEAYRGATGRAVDCWKMAPNHRQAYLRDPEVRHLHLAITPNNWTT